MQKIVVIAHDLRSTHNVGSLLRTAEGLGGTFVFLTGYTPYPATEHDERLPHERAKITKQISKTALGAENTPIWEHTTSIDTVLDKLIADGYLVAALEQTAHAIPLPEFDPPEKIAIILGREVEGIEETLLARCSTHLEIPMEGAKESFNVVQAAAMTLYHLKFHKKG